MNEKPKCVWKEMDDRDAELKKLKKYATDTSYRRVPDKCQSCEGYDTDCHDYQRYLKFRGGKE